MMAQPTVIKNNFYEMSPITLGVEVRGIDLSQEVSPDVADQIKKDVTEHRILVFKNQGHISGERQLEISKWFGEIDSNFIKHPRSPHPEVLRISNDSSEGCRGFGRTGLHVDGAFHEPAPFANALYYMESVARNGPTTFAPLNETIMGLGKEQLARWERLWICNGDKNRPLIYSHPKTGKKVLYLHLGMAEAYIWDKDTDNERRTDKTETLEITKEIKHELDKDDCARQYTHKWAKGDLIISDNQAVAHEASPETQYTVEEVGLRILHRTTVKSTEAPVKKY